MSYEDFLFTLEPNSDIENIWISTLTKEKLYKDTDFDYEIVEVRTVENPALRNKFEEKRNQFVKKNYERREYKSFYGFSVEPERKLCSLVLNGPINSPGNVHLLGNNRCGYRIWRHPDVCLKLAHFQKKQNCFLVMYKFMYGKAKHVIVDKYRKDPFNLLPTEGYDCHLSAINACPNISVHNNINNSQVYLYSLDPETHENLQPTQVYPIAVMNLLEKFVIEQLEENLDSVPEKDEAKSQMFKETSESVFNTGESFRFDLKDNFCVKKLHTSSLSIAIEQPFPSKFQCLLDCLYNKPLNERFNIKECHKTEAANDAMGSKLEKEIKKLRPRVRFNDGGNRAFTDMSHGFHWISVQFTEADIKSQFSKKLCEDKNNDCNRSLEKPRLEKKCLKASPVDDLLFIENKLQEEKDCIINDQFAVNCKRFNDEEKEKNFETDLESAPMSTSSIESASDTERYLKFVNEKTKLETNVSSRQKGHINPRKKAEESCSSTSRKKVCNKIPNLKLADMYTALGESSGVKPKSKYIQHIEHLDWMKSNNKNGAVIKSSQYKASCRSDEVSENNSRDKNYSISPNSYSEERFSLSPIQKRKKKKKHKKNSREKMIYELDGRDYLLTQTKMNQHEKLNIVTSQDVSVKKRKKKQTNKMKKDNLDIREGDRSESDNREVIVFLSDKDDNVVDLECESDGKASCNKHSVFERIGWSNQTDQNSNLSRISPTSLSKDMNTVSRYEAGYAKQSKNSSSSRKSAFTRLGSYELGNDSFYENERSRMEPFQRQIVPEKRGTVDYSDISFA